MKDTEQNRFVEEVEAAARNNPNIDMKLVREWQKIAEFLEKIPPSPPPQPQKTEPPRLQPIPLQMFR